MDRPVGLQSRTTDASKVGDNTNGVSARQITNVGLDHNAEMDIREDDLPLVNLPNKIRKGRNLFDGYRRGVAIQFVPELRERIAGDPLYQEARSLIEGRSILEEV